MIYYWFMCVLGFGFWFVFTFCSFKRRWFRSEVFDSFCLWLDWIGVCCLFFAIVLCLSFWLLCVCFILLLLPLAASSGLSLSYHAIQTIFIFIYSTPIMSNEKETFFFVLSQMRALLMIVLEVRSIWSTHVCRSIEWVIFLCHFQ